jgi:prophage DNA circulation protein
MTWRERLQPASFKGVPFYVERSSRAGGRRVPVRRLAGKDGSVQQDLGKEPAEFDVDAFVASDEFDTERDALEAALETEGPGVLRLPTRNELWVRVTRGPFSNDERASGGFSVVRFSVVVEPRAGRSGVRTTRDTPGKLRLKANVLSEAAKTDFLDVFDALAMPGKYITKAANAVQGVSQALLRVQGKINGTLNPIQNLTASIDSLGSAAADLISTPAVLATNINGLVLGVFGLADTTRAAVDRTTGIFNNTSASPYDRALSARALRLSSKDMNGLGDDEPADGSTALADRSAGNVRAVYRLARASALAAQALAYADVPFDSSGLALSVLESFAGELEGVQEYSATDALYYALSDVRAALTDHLTQTAVNLPKTIERVQHPPIPALLLAHLLYGDCRLDSDLIGRNRPSKPSFMSGTLEVLEP